MKSLIFLGSNKIVVKVNRTTTRNLAIITFLLFILTGANAQISNLRYKPEPTTFEEITGGTVLIPGGNVAYSQGNTLLAGPLTDIGFTVRYQGVDYTKFAASATGQLRLGNGSNVVDNSQANMNIPSIYAMWDNFTVATVASGGGVTYQLSGTAPNRVLTVQWKVTKTANTATQHTFQVKIYESSNLTNSPNKIELVYPPNSGAAVAGLSFSAGLNGHTNNHYISIHTANHAASKYEFYETNDRYPTSSTGFKYVFEPPVLSATPGGFLDRSRFALWYKADGEKRIRTLLNVPAANRTSSSNFSATLSAANSVLNTNSATSTGTGWTAVGGESVLPQHYITMDLGSITTVNGVAIQGRGDFNQYVRDFTVVVADDAAFTTNVKHLGLFNGIENNRFYINYADFYEPVTTRYIRIFPTGRIGGHRVLRCDAYTYTTAEHVADNTKQIKSLEDYSLNNNDAYVYYDGVTPIYKRNQINFNPALQFTNSAQSLYYVPHQTNIKAAYWVAQDEDPSGNNYYHVLYGGEPIGQTNVKPFFHGGSATRGGIQANGASWGATPQQETFWKDGGPATQETTLYDFGPNGKPNLISSNVLGSNWEKLSSISWQSAYTRGWQGKIAEVILLSGAAPISAQHNRIETYLGIKYGITIGHDYFNSNNSVIWSKSANAAYHNNVFGLYRADAQELHQRQAVSVNPEGNFIVLGNNGIVGAENSATTGNDIATNEAYLLIGDNNAPLHFNYQFNNPGNYFLLQRNWKAQSSGINTPTKLRIPAAGNTNPNALPKFEGPAIEGSNLYFALDADGDGDYTNATYTAMVYNDTDKVYEIDAVIPDGATFTFAVKENTLDSDNVQIPVILTT